MSPGSEPAPAARLKAHERMPAAQVTGTAGGTRGKAASVPAFGRMDLLHVQGSWSSPPAPIIRKNLSGFWDRPLPGAYS